MSPETLKYWQDVALDLIENRHLDWTDPHDVAVWVGRASAVMAEALRASGDPRGIDAILARRANADA